MIALDTQVALLAPREQVLLLAQALLRGRGLRWARPSQGRKVRAAPCQKRAEVRGSLSSGGINKGKAA